MKYKLYLYSCTKPNINLKVRIILHINMLNVIKTKRLKNIKLSQKWKKKKIGIKPNYKT